MNRTKFLVSAAFLVGSMFGAVIEHGLQVTKHVDAPALVAQTAVLAEEFPPTAVGSDAVKGVAMANSIYKGQQAVVPKWQWVHIETLGTGSHPHPGKWDDTCGIEPDGIVTAVGTMNDLVLVSYRPPPEADTHGTPCDGGETFLLEAKDFLTMTTRADTIKKEERQRRDAVDALLKH